MKRKQKIVEIKVVPQENGAMLLDKHRGIYFQVNDVGLIVFKGLANNKSMQELVEEITVMFSIDRKQAEIDVNLFLEQLKKEGFA